jgi:hypothetical protein
MAFAAGPLLGLHGAAGAADARPCRGLERPETAIEVRIEHPAAPRIVAVPERQIRERAVSAGLHEDRPNRRTSGLTATQIEGQAGYRLARATVREGRNCVALKSVTARLANRDVVVYVDGRYPEGSCERRAILDHELEHVRINRETLEQGRKGLRARLERAVEPWRGRWVPEDEVAAMDAAIGAAVSEGLAAVRAGAARQHARIDTPASYARTQRRCAGW